MRERLEGIPGPRPEGGVALEGGALRTLTLPLNGVYFDQIKAGTKTEEYRLATRFWARRIAGRAFDRVVLTKGYPKADDHERRLVLPWRGYSLKTITHPHFGPDPVEVFAIFVGPPAVRPLPAPPAGSPQ